jgi:hypothetical protein
MPKFFVYHKQADSEDAVKQVAPPAIRNELTVSELIEEVI